MFEQLTGELITWAALRTHGAAVLLMWMLTHGDDCVPLLVSASVTLCNGLAASAHRLCVDDVDSAELMAHADLFLWTRNQEFHLLKLIMFLGG